MAITRTIVSIAVLAIGMSFAPLANAQMFQDGSRDTTPPPGVEALPVDMWTTENFYLDSEYWTGPQIRPVQHPTSVNRYVAVRTLRWLGRLRPGPRRLGYSEPVRLSISGGTLQRSTCRSRGGRRPHHAHTGNAALLGRFISGEQPEAQWVYGRNLQSATMVSC